MYDPYSDMVGGFSPNDGTIDFYLRVRSLIRMDHTVLDLGAGRAAWHKDDVCRMRRETRLLKGSVHEFIASDIDESVLQNKASDTQVVTKNGALDEFQNGSVDLIIADFVLEHVVQPEQFIANVQRVLKSGGWFCARTPHKYNYVAVAARLTENSVHSRLLRNIQPKRKEIDVFPTAYKINTMRDVRRYFVGWSNNSFIVRSEPAYYFGSEYVFRLQKLMHHFMLKQFCGCLFVFVRKP